MSVTINLLDLDLLQGTELIYLKFRTVWQWDGGPGTYWVDVGIGSSTWVRTRYSGLITNDGESGYVDISREPFLLPFTGTLAAHLVIADIRTTASVSLYFDPLANAPLSWVGTAAQEAVFASGHGDTLGGMDGNDLLTGRAGHDSLSGDDGDDVLKGDTEHDTLAGGAGADTLVGGEGNDLLTGGADNDFMRGGGPGDPTGHDTLFGEDGADTLIGGGGDDLLTGGVGNDLLRGEGQANLTGNDTLLGGAGADTLDGRGGADSLDGGEGNDVYILDPTGGLVPEVEGGGHDRVIVSTETYTLGRHVEELFFAGTGAFQGIGNTQANLISGGGGADMLLGLGGADTLLGGDGADMLRGGGGPDRMEGGGGNDLYSIEDAGDVAIEAAGGGADTVRSTLDAYTLGADVEGLVLANANGAHGAGNALANRIVGGQGADTLDGAAGFDSLDGGGGADQLIGGDGEDRLDGGAGADQLSGGAGADSLVGGGGADTLTGGAGDDSYWIDEGRVQVVEEAGGGLDVVHASVSIRLAPHVEGLIMGGGAVRGVGNAEANGIFGNALDNLLLGLEGADNLFGSSGNDTLVGGVGRDALRGDVGADVYRFLSLAERGDQIWGFIPGEDRLEFSADMLGGGLAPGALDPARFVVNTSAQPSGSAGQFIWESDARRLWWDADGEGDGLRYFLAGFGGYPTLTAADILLI